MIPKIFRKSVWIFIFFTGCSYFQSTSRIIQGSFQQNLPGIVGSQQKIDYCVTEFRKSGNDAPFSLLYVMHGTGESGCDYVEKWKSEADRANLIILAPTRTRVYENTPEDHAIFYDLLNEVVKKYPINSDQITILGISSGALIGKWLISDRLFNWNQAVFISSPAYGGLVSSANSDYPSMLYIHGQRDEQCPLSAVKKEAEELKNMGVNVKFYLDPSDGHVYDQDWMVAIFDWIKEKNTSASK